MKVRLKRLDEFEAREVEISFNSMKVRLKPPGTPFNYTTNLFQFHEGPIKTLLIMPLILLLLSFNSMKVRLKPCTRVVPLLRMRFQFHEGPIKTHCIFQ